MKPQMAAKRPVNEHVHDGGPPTKKMKSYPSFASVIGEVMMVRSFSNICSAIEPLLRKVVTEEVEKGIQRAMPTFGRSCSFKRIQAPEPATLKLMFTNKSLPSTLFTCNKISDINGDPLQLALVEQRGDQITPTLPPFPLKVEIVVVNGNFPSTEDNSEIWTNDEFNRNMVKEREGKRPLLTKDLNYTMRDSSYVTLGGIEFTDNSSWIPCRKFRIGARVVAESSHGKVRILEALTDAFVVKDHRGELYKKHYPPQLEDEVWRLEKIGKEGKYHKRLKEANVRNVQDLLKLSVINPTSLKKILGGKNGISDRIWEAILKHAGTCNPGNKLYISRGTNFSIVLDSICQILNINFDGIDYSLSTLPTSLKNEVDRLVENAYKNWGSLEEVNGQVNETFQPPPAQGNFMVEYDNNEQNMMPLEFIIGGIIEVDAQQPW